MANINETVSSFTDFITKVNTWMITVGWTAEHLDTTTTAGTGGEWAMRRRFGLQNLRFAANWDGAGTPNNLALYQYVDQNYVIASRPWAQANDSGNGFEATTPDASFTAERHVIIGTTPIQYWGFEGDHYTYIVVETATDIYTHFGFGTLDKQGGDWTGGQFCYGQRNNLSNITGGLIDLDGVSFLLDGHFNDTAENGGPATGAELMAATVHCEGLPNQPASGQWAIAMGGSQASPQTTFGNDRQGSPIARVLFTWGTRGGPFANGFYRASASDLSGELRFWPIGVTYVDTNLDIYGFPLAYMPEVYGCHLGNHTGQEIISDDSSRTYRIFPANERYPGSGTGSSGALGIAYLISKPYVDPGLPASVDAPSAWYSSRDSVDYTETAGRITTLNDKSSNSNNLTESPDTGPDLLTIDGRVWMDFDETVPNRLSGANTATDPGQNDISIVCVFRSNANLGAMAITGKIQGIVDYYGMFLNTAGDSTNLSFHIRDAAGTARNALHNPTLPDYTDGTSRLCCGTYDDSLNDIILYGEDAVSVASDLTATTVDISPAVNLFIGDWSAVTSLNPYTGQIAEVLYYSTPLTTAQIEDVYGYLREKWGID